MIREVTENRFELIHILANQERVCAKYNVSINVKSKSQEFRSPDVLSACIGNNRTLHSKKPMDMKDIDLSLSLISHVVYNVDKNASLQEIAAMLSMCCSTRAPQILWVLEQIIYEIPEHSLVLSKDRALWSRPNLYRWDYYEVEDVTFERLSPELRGAPVVPHMSKIANDTLAEFEKYTHSGMDVNDVIILE